MVLSFCTELCFWTSRLLQSATYERPLLSLPGGEWGLLQGEAKLSTIKRQLPPSAWVLWQTAVGGKGSVLKRLSYGWLVRQVKMYSTLILPPTSIQSTYCKHTRSHLPNFRGQWDKLNMHLRRYLLLPVCMSKQNYNRVGTGCTIHLAQHKRSSHNSLEQNSFSKHCKQNGKPSQDCKHRQTEREGKKEKRGGGGRELRCIYYSTARLLLSRHCKTPCLGEINIKYCV